MKRLTTLLSCFVLATASLFAQDNADVGDLKGVLVKEQAYLRAVSNVYVNDEITAVVHMYKDQFGAHYYARWDSKTYQLKEFRRLPYTHVENYFQTIDGSYHLWLNYGELLVSNAITEKPNNLASCHASVVEFTTASDKVVTAGELITIRTIPSLEIVKQFKGPKAPITKLRMTTSQEYVFASAKESTTVLMYDVASGKQVRKFEEKSQRKGTQITDFDITRDGSLLLTAYGDVLKVWDTATGNMLYELNSPSGARHVLWSPEGKKFSFIDSGSLVIYDYENKAELARIPNVDYESRLFPANFGSAIGFQSRPDRGLTIVDFETGIVINQFK